MEITINEKQKSVESKIFKAGRAINKKSTLEQFCPDQEFKWDCPNDPMWIVFNKDTGVLTVKRPAGITEDTSVTC